MADSPTPPRTVLAGELKLTRGSETGSSGSSTARDLPVPSRISIVDPAALALLPEEQQRSLAGKLGLLPSVLNAARAEGLPLALSGKPPDDLPTLTRTPAGWFGAFATLGFTGLSTLNIATALGLFVLVGPVVSLSVAALAAVNVSAAAGLAWRQRRASQRYQDAVRALQLSRKHRPPQLTAPTWAHLWRVTDTINQADLPEAVATDLRSGLREVERQLSALDAAHAQLEAAISAVNRAELEGTRAALIRKGDSHSAEAQRVDRTLSDLNALEARGAALHAERASLDSALDEAVAALVHAAHSTDGDAAAKLKRTARQVAASLAEPHR